MKNALLFFFLGIVFIQSFFILYQYMISARKEFLYYLAYVIFITVVICFHWMSSWGDALRLVTPEGQFFLARAILLLALAFYYGFGRHFCDMAHLHTSQNTFQLRLERGMILFCVFDIVSCLIYRDYFFPDIIVKVFFVMLMLYSIYIVWFLATRKRILNTILVTGSSFLLVGGIIYAIEYVRTDNSLPGSYYMQFYIYGVILEFMFLNFGLIYKSKLVQEEHTRIIHEKQFQFQTQRNQLVDDLQDEVGGGLSAIRMACELLDTSSGSAEKRKTLVAKIIQSTESVAREMNAIAWSLNTNNDTIEQTVEYISQYAYHYFEIHHLDLKCLHQVLQGDQIKINGLSRKNVVSVCKQVFENIVQFANASQVFYNASVTDQTLTFRISDNGSSFYENEGRYSLLKLENLMADVKGCICIEYHNGSIVTIICPIQS